MSHLHFRLIHKRSQFFVKEDLKILLKVRNGNKQTWDKVSIEISRPKNAILYRWHQILKPKLIQKSAKANTDLELILDQEISLLQRENNSKNSTLQRATNWTPEMDQKLLETVQKLGPVFSLMKTEFPEFSSGQLSARYNSICPFKLFSSEDIEKLELGLKRFKGQSNISYLIHTQYLPRHSPLLISRKLKELEDLTIKRLGFVEIQHISKQVAKYGRLYFYLGDQNFQTGYSFRDLLTLWAFYEPADQVNAVWSQETDSETIKYFKNGQRLRPDILKDFFASELECRMYYLSTTTNPVLKQRFEHSK